MPIMFQVTPVLYVEPVDLQFGGAIVQSRSDRHLYLGICELP